MTVADWPCHTPHGDFARELSELLLSVADLGARRAGKSLRLKLPKHDRSAPASARPGFHSALHDENLSRPVRIGYHAELRAEIDHVDRRIRYTESDRLPRNGG